MDTFKATINWADEHLKVLLSPAVEGMVKGPLQGAEEPKEITLVSLVDDRTFEPAQYHNPYFVLPVELNKDRYISFLQTLRHTDKFAMAAVKGLEKCHTGVLYPYKNFLMFVLIRAEEELKEPEAPDWAAEAVKLTAGDVAVLRTKLESLTESNNQARGAYNSK
jgi:non-homologous end joining protein Ku